MQYQWPGFPRHDERFGVRLAAVVHRSDGSQVPVQVTDCSSHGCRLASGQDFVTGERITIELASSDQFAAEVRWAETGKAGVRFVNSPIA